ncbi:RICIN domain-containing protein [Saccharothrix variisporea]|nr:RICIN domain-containing protein [Saccharothrix variisporea]
MRRIPILLLTVLATLGLAPAAAHAEAVTGWVYVVNTATRKCLAIPDGTTAVGTKAVQWTCNGRNEQKWLITGTGRSTLRYGVNSNLCLAIPGGTTEPFVEPIIWTCSTNTDQLWYGFDGQDTLIRNAASGLYLDGVGSGTSMVVQYSFIGDDHQKWYFVQTTAP